ncbi:PAS domain-containing protein, partial [bacterium]|nr:PAS domain-containing protein [bacterium]
KESEERLREVLENSLDASYKRDLRTNTYDYFSPVSERIFGYTQDEMKFLSVDSALDLIHPDDAPQLERVLAQAMSDSGGTSWQTEYRFKHK